ncbi:MAG TPA: ABC transporter ATP-binding protein, partial [Bacilli bacterium]
MKSKRPVIRRLIQYMLQFKGPIGLAFIILFTAIGAQLAGPFIAKVVIDKHILGIERVWYQADPAEVPRGLNAVSFRGKSFVRDDWFDETTEQYKKAWMEAQISQVEQDFYLIPVPVKLDGKWILVPNSLADSLQIEIKDEKGEKNLYPALKLTPAELRSFYQHDLMPVLLLIGLFIFLLFASNLLTFFQSYLLQATALRIIQKLRMDIMSHIQLIPLRYFDNTPIGQIVSRIANDTEAIKELFISFMATFVVSGVTIIGIIVALFILDPPLALIAVLLLPLFTVIIVIHLKYSKIYISIMRARLADMYAMLNESIVVMPIIQAFRKEEETMKEFEALNHDRYINQVKQFRVFSVSSRNAVGLIGSLVTAIVIWYFGQESLQTAIEFGVFYAFIDYLSRFYQPIIGFFDQLLGAQRAIISAERVFNLMDEETEDAWYAKA